MKTCALIISKPGQIALEEIEIPEPGPGEVLVEVEYSCISPGTELRVLAGKQTGAPAFPFIPGYSAAGIVSGGGPGTTLKEGTRVFCLGTVRASVAVCWGGHVAHAVLAEEDVVKIPDNISLRQAVAAKLCAISYHGVRLSAPLPHENVLVLGLGPIGFFSALLHKAAGTFVVVIEPSTARRAIGQAAGLRVIIPEDVAFPDGADIVVDATGSPAVLRSAVLHTRVLPPDNHIHPPARLVIQGSYASPPAFPYDEAFAREVRILVPRDNQRRDLDAVLGFMARGLLDTTACVANYGAPANAPKIYAALASSSHSGITGCFDWKSP